ncbi:MAG: hypothetical protein LDL26_08935 [Caenispirillum bisanense]|nr:hypothetical protein [Caenispirillum bisanense]
MRGVLGSLRAFLASGVKPRGRLARAIVPVLVIKVCIVLLAKVFVFGGDNKVVVTPDSMSDRLTAPASAAPRES